MVGILIIKGPPYLKLKVGETAQNRHCNGRLFKVFVIYRQGERIVYDKK